MRAQLTSALKMMLMCASKRKKYEFNAWQLVMVDKDAKKK